ncbi:hypothetical protein DFQ29_001907 [Apophysomyces sp. BC1021]|nr:hypothetical protein DFQ29_001907 [Apophysomyces sp. BC1021]
MLQFRLEKGVFDNSQWKDNNDDPHSLKMSRPLGTETEPMRLHDLPERPFDIINAVVTNDIQPEVDIQIEESIKQPQKECITDDVDVWTDSNDHIDSFRILSWEQLRHQTSQLQEERVTPFLTEASLQCYEPLFQKYFHDQQSFPVVKEETLVKGLVQALMGLPSICYRWDEQKRLFEPRVPNSRILGVSTLALKPVIEDILLLSTRLKKMEYLIGECKANPSRYGFTGVAFACCLGELHINIQHSISTMFEDLDNWTVLKIRQYTDSLDTVMERLTRLCNLDSMAQDVSLEAKEHIARHGFYIPFGAALLTMLHDEIQAFDFSEHGNSGFYRDICVAILCHTSTPYLDMLSQWLGLREPVSEWINVNYLYLQDPYDEFFIHDTKTLTTTRSAAFLENYSLSEDMDDLPYCYQLREDMALPYFINERQAAYILRAGNALRLLRRCQPDHPLSAVRRWLNTETGDGLRLQWLLTDSQRKKYMEELTEFCLVARSYDANGVIDGYNECSKDIDGVPVDRNPIAHDVEMKELGAAPSLAVLEDLDLTGEFSKTLHGVMEHHQLLAEHVQENTNTTYFIPTLDVITSESIHRPLRLWYPLVNESAMNLFMRQFNAREHLKMLHRYFLFGEGTFVSGIVNTLFANGEDPRAPERAGLRLRLHSQIGWPPRPSELNMPLRAVLLESMAQIPEKDKSSIMKSIQGHMISEQPDNLITFGVRERNESSEWNRLDAVGALDFLYMSYQTQYPLNIIITPDTLEKYNSVFTFLLQVLRISTISKQLYYRLHSRSQTWPWHNRTTSGTLHNFRFQIERFTSAIQAYVFDTAINATWAKFMVWIDAIERHSESADLTMMDPVIFSKHHEEILDRILFQCFLKRGQYLIMSVLRQVFEDVIAFVIILDDYKIRQPTPQQEMDLVHRCQQTFDKFRRHTKLFIKVLNLLLRKGTVRVGNITSSLHEADVETFDGSYKEWGDQKSNLGDFIKDLLTRLSFNGFYGAAEENEAL